MTPTGGAASRLDQILAEVAQLTQEIEEVPGAGDGSAMPSDLAERNRKGERGPDWLVLQARLDRHETSVEAIFDGADASPQAQSVRAASHAGIASLYDQWAEREERDPYLPSPATDASAMLGELADRVAALKATYGIAGDER